METYQLIINLVDKYGLPLAFSIYLMFLQWKFHSKTVSALGRIEGKLDIEKSASEESKDG